MRTRGCLAEIAARCNKRTQLYRFRFVYVLSERKDTFRHYVLVADFVEEVGEQFEMNRPGHSKDADCEPLMVSGWLRAWHRYQLGQLSEVLGGCCEKELITRTIRPS